MDDKKIEGCLRQAPMFAPPDGLYQQIKTAMGIEPIERKSFFTRKMFGTPRFATVSLLVVAVIGLATGAALMNMTRWKNYKDVPVERRQGVTEPIAFHAEDIAPIPPEWVKSMLDHVARAERMSRNGEKTYPAFTDILADGSIYDYMRKPAEDLYGPEPRNYIFYSTFHPNDHKCAWNYHEDGTPIGFKNVKPVHRDHVSTRGLVGLTRNLNNNVNYQLELDPPRSNHIWLKFDSSLIVIWRVEKTGGGRMHVKKNAGWSYDEYASVSEMLRLPAGTTVVETKPKADVRIDDEGHPVVTFTAKLDAKHEAPAMEVTYLPRQ